MLDVPNKFMETCELPRFDFKIEPFTMVIFGGSGDLSQRKLLPSLYHLYHEEKLIKEFSILGFGLPIFSDTKYRNFIKSAVQKFSPQHFDQKKFSCSAKAFVHNYRPIK